MSKRAKTPARHEKQPFSFYWEEKQKAKNLQFKGAESKQAGNGKILGLITGGEAWFLAKFFAIFSLLEAAVNWAGFSGLQEFIASSTGAALGLRTLGNLVFLDGAGIFEINPSCTGLVSSSILFAIVFSLRRPQLWKKAAIFLCGSALLLALNYFRVLAVLWAGREFGAAAADAVHVASWFSTTLFVLALWYYFTKKITGAKDFSGFM